MRISPISSMQPIGSLNGVKAIKGNTSIAESENGTSFKEIVKNSIGEVNKLQNQADQSAVKLATGDIEDVHRAMIDMQKAKLALDFTIQVRNKVIEAYQEIMRTQV